MFRMRSFPLWECLLVCFFFSLSSCKKDPNSMVGDVLQPEDEFLQAFFSDTATALDVVCFTVPNDTLLLQDGVTTLLGTMNDPTFGTSTYNYVVDLRRDVLFPFVPEGATLDSVILEMAYSSSFRLENTHNKTPLTVNITELGETLNEDSSYYSHEAPILSSTKLLDNYTFTPNPFDTLPDSNATILNSLKMRLSDDFGKRLMEARKDDYYDGSSCNSFFKGFSILFNKARQENSGNIFCIHTAYAKGTGVVVYYKEENDTLQKEAYFYFGTAKHTYIERDLTNANPDFKKQLAGDTALGQQKIYIQAMGGAQMKFKLPKILQLKDHKIIVNNAYIVMKNAQFGQGVNVEPPARLTAFLINENGSISELPDNYPSPGGTYNSNTGEYRLPLTRYIQSLLFKNSESTYITVAPYSQYIRPDQVILYGPDKSFGENRMHLKIIYTQIPE